jgi:DNA polymerase III epsilon subunit-like protein
MELCAHFDVETTGPLVTQHSMIQLGIIFVENDKEIGTYKYNIKEVEGKRDETTMNFWYASEKRKLQFNTIINDNVSVEYAMLMLAERLIEYKNKGYYIKWIARPASFDWPWLKNYFDIYCPKEIIYDGKKYEKPSIGFKATCLSSMWDLYTLELTKNERDELWNRWSEGLEFTHDALDDCRFQANIYKNLCRNVNKERKKRYI